METGDSGDASGDGSADVTIPVRRKRGLHLLGKYEEIEKTNRDKVTRRKKRQLDSTSFYKYYFNGKIITKLEMGLITFDF